MEKYTINGVEVEYDTFDLDNIEKLDEAVQNILETVDGLRERMAGGENAAALLREQANAFLDFFDDVLGDGSARKIFGDRVNILKIANGYREFTDAVAEEQKKLAQTAGQPRLNRDQRRARR